MILLEDFTIKAWNWGLQKGGYYAEEKFFLQILKYQCFTMAM